MAPKEKSQRGRGRPCKLTPAHEHAIAALVAHGVTINGIADYLMVNRSTVLRYCKGGQFCHRYKRAKIEGEVRSLNVLAHSTQWQAHAWLLERRFPKKYLKRTVNEIIDHRATPGDTFTGIEHGELAGVFDSPPEKPQLRPVEAKAE